MRPKILAAITLMMAANLAAGQQTVTLQEAVRTALANNHQMAAADQRKQAADAQAKEAAAHRLPSVVVTEAYQRTDSPAEAFALLLNQERFDMMGFFQSNPNDPDPLTTWMTRLELVQPVYTGGKLSARIGQAKLFSEATQMEKEQTRRKVAWEAVSAYLDAAKAREYLDLVRKARDTTKEHVKLAKDYAEEGFIVEAEVLKAEVYLAEMEEMLEKAETGFRLARAALAFAMGVDQMSPPEPGPVPEAPEISGDLEYWINRALEGRKDLQAAKKKVAAAGLEVKVAKSEFLPEVAVMARYDLFDKAAFGSHGDSSAVMAVARVKLFEGGSRWAALTKTKHQYEAYKRDLKLFEEGIRLQVQDAWRSLQTAKARLGTARSALDAAREALRVREERFKQGLDKMIDLLDASTALREAEVRELVARFDVIRASYRLLFVSGEDVPGYVGAGSEE